MEKKRPLFKSWERALILLAILLLLLSSWAYLSNFPLSKYILGFGDDEGQVLVGKLTAKTGSLRRQLSGETEFKAIEVAAPLFNQDVLVTSDASTAMIDLGNGPAKVDLGPQTMVRLSFENLLGFDGINRFGRLDVVVGKVTVQAGNEKIFVNGNESYTINRNSSQQVEVANLLPEPSPLPSPPTLLTVVPSPTPSVVIVSAEQADKTKILTPKNGEHFDVDPGSQAPEKKIVMSWRANTPDAKINVTLWKLQPNEKGATARKEVFTNLVTSQNGKGSASWVAKNPARFEWEISGPNHQAISTPENTHGQFTVDSQFDGIKILPPLIGGRTSQTNRLSGDLVKDFDITIRWENYPKATKYNVWFGKNPKSPEALLQRTVKDPKFTFNKNKIFAGQLYYKISAPLPSGFVASTGVKLFNFDFLPPILVVPEDKAQVTSQMLAKENHSLLFTWQKTNFTDGYELEVAKDAGFTQTYIKQTLKENYYVLPRPALGTYWWRVRSFSKQGLSSPMSAPYQFSILP